MNDVFAKFGLKFKEVEDKPCFKVEMKGDYNDGDETITHTYYELDDPEDMKRFAELMDILQEQANADDDDQMTDWELVDAIWNLVDLPMGPYGVCHTIYYLSLSYVDETGMEREVEGIGDADWDVLFPLTQLDD